MGENVLRMEWIPLVILVMALKDNVNMILWNVVAKEDQTQFVNVRMELSNVFNMIDACKHVNRQLMEVDGVIQKHQNQPQNQSELHDQLCRERLDQSKKRHRDQSKRKLHDQSRRRHRDQQKNQRQSDHVQPKNQREHLDQNQLLAVDVVDQRHQRMLFWRMNV